jgi:hypothetical protein
VDIFRWVTLAVIVLSLHVSETDICHLRLKIFAVDESYLEGTLARGGSECF